MNTQVIPLFDKHVIFVLNRQIVYQESEFIV